MSETIEVGDVFNHAATGDTEFTAIDICDGKILDNTGEWNRVKNCTLVRKAAKDPYADLTLPSPPAGYRLAKWGEEWTQPAFRWDCDSWINSVNWVDWPTGSEAVVWNASVPHACIFAIPIDPPASTAPKSWQFRHDPWVPPQPKTLADVSEGVAIVALCSSLAATAVVSRYGDFACYWESDTKSIHSPESFRFVRYLDPPQPAQLRLEDVPDGRCIQVGGDLFWKSPTGNWMRRSGEFIRSAAAASEFTEFTVTDYIAEFREASC